MRRYLPQIADRPRRESGVIWDNHVSTSSIIRLHNTSTSQWYRVLTARYFPLLLRALPVYSIRTEFPIIQIIYHNFIIHEITWYQREGAEIVNYLSSRTFSYSLHSKLSFVKDRPRLQALSVDSFVVSSSHFHYKPYLSGDEFHLLVALISNFCLFRAFLNVGEISTYRLFDKSESWIHNSPVFCYI